MIDQNLVPHSINEVLAMGQVPVRYCEEMIAPLFSGDARVRFVGRHPENRFARVIDEQTRGVLGQWTSNRIAYHDIAHSAGADLIASRETLLKGFQINPPVEEWLQNLLNVVAKESREFAHRTKLIPIKDYMEMFEGFLREAEQIAGKRSMSVVMGNDAIRFTLR